jgi:hypothetical protein
MGDVVREGAGMKLEEARKLATPGPLHYDDGYHATDGIVVVQIGPDGTGHDMSLLAHCYNHFDEVVQALEKHIQAQRDTGLADNCIVGADVLAKAKEVKV